MLANSVESVFSLDPEQINFFTKRLRSQDPEKKSSSNLYGCSSVTGFLAPDEDLLQCCEEDRRTLIDRKITYYTIAVRLSSIFRDSQEIGKSNLVENKFKVTVDGPWMNAQFCPFTISSDHNASPFESIKNPCSMANLDITITNVVSGRTIKFSSLLPHLIHKHHFFEGRVPHRLAPLDLIETLEIPSDTNFIRP